MSSILSLLNYYSLSIQPFPSLNANLPPCLFYGQCSDGFPYSSIFLHGLSPSRRLALSMLQVPLLTTQTPQFPVFDLQSPSYHCVSSVFPFSALWDFSFQDNVPQRCLPLSSVFQYGPEELYHLSQCGPRTSWADLIISFCDVVPFHHTFLPLWAHEPVSPTNSLGTRATLYPFYLQGLFCLIVGSHNPKGWLTSMERTYGWSKGPDFKTL